MTVELRYLTPAADDGWNVLFDLADEETQSWLLIGGQMMLILAVEHGGERVRPTDDIDVVVDLRVRPTGTEWLSSWLQRRGFELEGVSPEGIGHRFLRPTAAGLGKVVFDVLAPAGFGKRTSLRTVPPARTVAAPGTRQAFTRSRLIDMLISDLTNQRERFGRVPCPDLLGALVAKAAATKIAIRENPERDWQDCGLLLSVLGDPVAEADRCTKRDREHLARLRPLFDKAHEGWANLSGDARDRGTAALSFLIE